MQEKPKSLRRYKQLTISTIIAVYLLILVGGIVRSSGSGMGCPDWPKCFGNWVPPTSVDQLPVNYKEVYSEKRHQKNIRLTGYLEKLGFSDTADKLKNDPSVREEADFNPLRTWIEYVNRLVGVVIGMLIFATFVYSIRFRKTQPKVFIFSLLAFVGVVFQGWVGSIVVSTNLLPGMISFHMLLALLIVMLLIYTYFTVDPPVADNETGGDAINVKWLLLGCAALFIVQLIVGINVREGVDSGLSAGIERSAVLEWIGFKFYFHRSFSWALLIGHVLLTYFLWTSSSLSFSVKFSAVLTLVVFLEIVSGAAMGYFSIPAFIQPIHLLLASVVFGFQVYLFLRINRKDALNIKHSI
ncbi:MAG: COX15/CtaA family protein [Imperialibacter sp.]|uniref:COX15/CtaA family protein n=1 Tax=Imperialibacter sp. TaxID=2038411 RepID=UPI0032EFD1A7